jgi:hypothetical protein
VLHQERSSKVKPQRDQRDRQSVAGPADVGLQCLKPPVVHGQARPAIIHHRRPEQFRCDRRQAVGRARSTLGHRPPAAGRLLAQRSGKGFAVELETSQQVELRIELANRVLDQEQCSDQDQQMPGQPETLSSAQA